jgi:septal ring factor EnvC (AmiA/AmiB activator)
MMPKMLINSRNKKQILKIIDTWQGKLSWELLCDRITRELDLKNKISRHTLLAYAEFKIAFDSRKSTLRDNPSQSPKATDLELGLAHERIDRLEAQVKRLEDEKSAVMEQFIRWQHNLYQMNVDMDALQLNLNNPLPAIDRANAHRRKR